MDELTQLKIDTERNCKLLAKWAREQADKIDKLNGKTPPDYCEHCGMTAEKCRCYDLQVAA